MIENHSPKVNKQLLKNNEIFMFFILFFWWPQNDQSWYPIISPTWPNNFKKKVVPIFSTTCHHILSYDIIWYQMISYDIIWHHMISYNIIWHHMISYDIIWYHMISYDIIWHHMISYDIIWCFMISYDSRGWRRDWNRFNEWKTETFSWFLTLKNDIKNKTES